MKCILHISADFPDLLVPAKTRAVASLVAAAPGYRHLVYSLNRVSWRSGVHTLPFGEDRVAIAYGAPPYGLALAQHLRPVALAIQADLSRRRVAPDLIHAHKFSVEGLVAAEIAAKTGRPFIASLWGDSDIKIFEAKRSLRTCYRDIARKARLLLPAAPWTGKYFAQALSLDDEHFEVLPVITAADAIFPPVVTDAPKFLTVLSLDSWRRKGLDTLAAATAALKERMPNLIIDIYGSGSPKSFIDAQRVIREAGAELQMRFMGPMPNGDIQRTMNSYAGFLMPTRRETYGMVHVEALLAGVPILWSKDRGIDGLLDGLEVGYLCDPSSVEDVTAGIQSLFDRQAELKSSITRLQENGAFEHLRRSDIGKRYRAILARVLDEARVSRQTLAADTLQHESHAS
jgi:glycosyltransferase involved in cell wall biosynthesis